MGDSKIEIITDQSSQEANGEVGRGTQMIFQPNQTFSSAVKRLVEVTSKRGHQLRHGHVNRRDSSQPIGKGDDQNGAHPQYSTHPSNDLTAQKMKAYEPQIVSLGPFHPPNETIKDSLRISDGDFKELIDNMNCDRQKIRHWYVQRNCLKRDEELGRMMARDGLFLLQFLREISHRTECPAYSFVGRVRRSQQPFAVHEDVMKIKNQIPIFVLQKILQWEARIYEWESGADQDLNSILMDSWSNLCPIRCMCDGQDGGARVREYWHLLEFVYENIIGGVGDGATVRGEWHLLEFVYQNIICCCLQKRRKKNRGDSRITLPSAVQLKARGVKFDQIKEPLAQIHFDRRNLTLYLPAIKITGKTDVVLRNLVEFEKSKSEKQQPLMSYVDLMERLVNKADDVEVLRNGGIIHSHLGTDDEVASLWNGMRELLPEDIEYEPIENAVDDVITFYTSKYRRMCAEFNRRHCSKPWLVLSVISAFILLVLTVLQTLLAWEQVRLQQESMHKI